MVQGQPEDQGGRQVYRQVYRVRRERVRSYARDCGKENFPFRMHIISICHSFSPTTSLTY